MNTTHEDTKALLEAINDAAHDLEGLESGALLQRAANAIRELEGECRLAQIALDALRDAHSEAMKRTIRLRGL